MRRRNHGTTIERRLKRLEGSLGKLRIDEFITLFGDEVETEGEPGRGLACDQYELRGPGPLKCREVWRSKRSADDWGDVYNERGEKAGRVEAHDGR